MNLVSLLFYLNINLIYHKWNFVQIFQSSSSFNFITLRTFIITPICLHRFRIICFSPETAEKYLSRKFMVGAVVLHCDHDNELGLCLHVKSVVSQQMPSVQFNVISFIK